MPNNTFDNIELVNVIDLKINGTYVKIENENIRLFSHRDTAIKFKNNLEGTLTLSFSLNSPDISNYVQIKNTGETEDDEGFLTLSDVIYDFTLTKEHTDVQVLANAILADFLESKDFEKISDEAFDIVEDYRSDDDYRKLYGDES